MAAPSSTPLYWRSYRKLPGRAEFFPSDASLRWFIRLHEPELVKKGAMIRHYRKPMIITERFDKVIIEIGKRQAQTFARSQTEG